MVNALAFSIFLIGITVVLMLSFAGKVQLSLLFLVPLFPLQNIIERLQQFPFGKDFIDIILIAMIIGWAFNSAAKREKMFVPTSFNKLLFLMVIFTFISLWRGSFFLGFPAPVSPADPRVQTWKNYMIFPLLFFLTANNIKSIKQMKWIVLAMALSMLLMDHYTANQIRWMPSLLSRSKINGTFVWLGPNESAAFYATYTFVLLGIFLFYKKKVIRFLFLAIIVINLYCALFLYSRGAYVAILAGLIVMSIVKKQKLLLVSVLILLSFWQIVLPPKVIERIDQTRTEEGSFDPSTEHRLAMWEQSIELFENNLIMGAGFNTIPYLGYELGDTHNIFVKILAEQGLIGITIFLLLFWLALRSSWKLYVKSKDMFLKGMGLGFFVCVIATMFTNFFGDRWTYLQLGAYFWVFLGLVVRGNILVDQKTVKIPSNKVFIPKKNKIIKDEGPAFDQ